MPDETLSGPSPDTVEVQGQQVQLQNDCFAPSGRVLLRKGTILTVVRSRLEGNIVQAELNGREYMLLPGEFRYLAIQ